MKKQQPYRGKYPNRIKAIWINRRRNIPQGLCGMFAQTNDGITYKLVEPCNPRLGEDICDYLVTKKIQQYTITKIEKEEPLP